MTFLLYYVGLVFNFKTIEKVTKKVDSDIQANVTITEEKLSFKIATNRVFG